MALFKFFQVRLCWKCGFCSQKGLIIQSVLVLKGQEDEGRDGYRHTASDGKLGGAWERG